LDSDVDSELDCVFGASNGSDWEESARPCVVVNVEVVFSAIFFFFANNGCNGRPGLRSDVVIGAGIPFCAVESTGWNNEIWISLKWYKVCGLREGRKPR